MKTIIVYIALIIGFLPVTQAQKKSSEFPEKNSLPKVFAGSIGSKRDVYIKRIECFYPQQLNDPGENKRHSMSQFGYIFPMAEFIKKGDFGEHSYGGPARTERNGALYTLQGGFIDFSHVRVAADWTVYLTFKILCEQDSIVLSPEAGDLTLYLKNIDKLSLDEVTTMAQKIAFERLTWHETASWYYHRPYIKISEQQSAFTPEDNYSNFTGTVIGKSIALRLLNNPEGLPYAQVATEEIKKYISGLDPVKGRKETKQAYKLVDLTRQGRIDESKRNQDVWWDSKIIFIDQRYVFKRYMNIGPNLEPWLVDGMSPSGRKPEARVLTVPSKTKKGESFYKYYDFVINPDSKMFEGEEKPVKHNHTPFPAFSTSEFDKVIEQVRKEMEPVFRPGFDERNCETYIAQEEP